VKETTPKALVVPDVVFSVPQEAPVRVRNTGSLATTADAAPVTVTVTVAGVFSGTFAVAAVNVTWVATVVGATAVLL